MVFLLPEPEKRNRLAGGFSNQTYAGLVSRGLAFKKPWRELNVAGRMTEGEVWTLTDKGVDWLRANKAIWGFAQTAEEKFALAALR